MVEGELTCCGGGLTCCGGGLTCCVGGRGSWNTPSRLETSCRCCLKRTEGCATSNTDLTRDNTDHHVSHSYLTHLACTNTDRSFNENIYYMNCFFVMLLMFYFVT